MENTTLMDECIVVHCLTRVLLNTEPAAGFTRLQEKIHDRTYP